MALIANLSPPCPTLSSLPQLNSSTRHHEAWSSLQQNIRSNARFSCLFSSNNNKEEQARKALENALGGKRDEFERWSKEIKKREEGGGGGNTAGGGGGWFGPGGRFGWFNDDHFWEEARNISLTVLGIVLLYLIVAKGELMLAVCFNPLLYALRSTRNGLSLAASKILGRTSPDSRADLPALKKDDYKRVSAKDRVISKWGSV